MTSLTTSIVLALFSILMPGVMVLPFTICYITNKKQQKIIQLSVGMAIIWAAAGFCFRDPASNPDLVRYLAMLKDYADKSFFECINLHYENLFLVDIYFFIIAQIGIPQLLPAISVFVFYFIVFYILEDYKIRIGLADGTFGVFLFAAISAINFCSIVNGIRWPMAVIVFTLAVYRELIQERKNFWTYLLYILPVFMHFSMLIFIAVRLALLIKNKKIIVIIGLSAALLPRIFEILAKMILARPSNFITYSFVYFIQRGNMYFKWNVNDAGWASTVSKSIYYKVEALYYYAIVALVIFVFFMLNRKDKNRKMKRSDIFVFYLVALTLVSFTMSAHTYIRFVTPLIICFSWVCFKFFKCFEHRKNVTIFSYIAMLGAGFIGIYLNLHLLNSMVNLKEYLTEVFVFGFWGTLIG